MHVNIYIYIYILIRINKYSSHLIIKIIGKVVGYSINLYSSSLGSKANVDYITLSTDIFSKSFKNVNLSNICWIVTKIK